MIATPTFPYDPHSVWNRNQLGALSLTDPTTLMMLAAGGFAIYYFMKKGKRIF